MGLFLAPHGLPYFLTLAYTIVLVPRNKTWIDEKPIQLTSSIYNKVGTLRHIVKLEAPACRAFALIRWIRLLGLEIDLKSQI